MSGDDLTVVLFFAAVGITFMIAGVQGEKWKRRLFISLASVCLVCAIEWDAIKSSSPTIASNISKIANNTASWFSGIMFIATAWVTARYLMKRVSHPEIDRYELAARAESLAQQVSELLGEYMERLENARSEERSERHLREHRDPWSRQSEVEAKATRRFHEQYNREFWSIIALAQKCVPLDFGDIWRVSHGMSFRDIQQVPTILVL